MFFPLVVEDYLFFQKLRAWFFYPVRYLPTNRTVVSEMSHVFVEQEGVMNTHSCLQQANRYPV